MGFGSRALHRASKLRLLHSPRHFSTSLAVRNVISAADLKFGQAVHETHPHLLQAGEVTPGISAQEYADRRAKLSSLLPIGSVAILAASEVKYRSGAVFYQHFQNPDFLYFTGFKEPEALAVIEKTGIEDEDYRFRLYVQPRDPAAEIWDGARSGLEAAVDVFNADEAGDINHIQRDMPSIVQNATEVYTNLPKSVLTNSPLARYLSGINGTSAQGFPAVLSEIPRANVRPLRPLINDLRIFKSEAEIRNMRKAGQISGRVVTDAMRHQFSGEKDLWAFLEYQFKLQGCDGPAYVPVVATGQNALSIHYVRNDDVFKNDELVLVDAGGEYGGYITDITRTWPTNGRFNPAQRDLYSAILKVQRSCVSLCREDASISLDRIHEISETALYDTLKQLGFDMSKDALSTLYPHHIGHHIGLDVHDAPGYSRGKPLKTGQCITIEPGIYVPDDPRWPKHFRGMGIRIEDSICIQSDGPLVFTTEAVKEVEDIEALRD